MTARGSPSPRPPVCVFSPPPGRSASPRRGAATRSARKIPIRYQCPNYSQVCRAQRVRWPSHAIRGCACLATGSSVPVRAEASRSITRQAGLGSPFECAPRHSTTFHDRRYPIDMVCLTRVLVTPLNLAARRCPLVISKESRRKFFKEGYIVVRGGLKGDVTSELAKFSTLLQTVTESHRKSFPYQGSMIPASLTESPWPQVVSHDSIIATLHELGAQDLRWLSGYLISKPPHSPRLWWHQDWWAWNSELSYSDMPAQISVMMYPNGANEGNGCLRVIPGSHRRRHRLHDVLPAAHTEEINRLALDHPAFGEQPDEVSVPLSPVDFVVCDVRLLHSTFDNTGSQERPGVTLWYIPNFSSLPQSFRRHYAQNQCQPSRDDRKGMQSLSRLIIPDVDSYDGAQIALQRSPGSDFK